MARSVLRRVMRAKAKILDAGTKPIPDIIASNRDDRAYSKVYLDIFGREYQSFQKTKEVSDVEQNLYDV